MSYPTKWCKKVEEVPSDPHFVILKNKHINVPEEGRDYPAHTEEVLDYCLYKDRAAWEKEICELVKKGETGWKAIQVTPAKITTLVNVTVE